MAKRYYKIDERIWIKALKKSGRVVSLDIPNLSASISFYEDGDLKTRVMKFEEIDKARKDEKKVVKTSPKIDKSSDKKDTILFAKVREDAIIPSKNFEDAGYDFYANFPQDELTLQRTRSTLVPTGIAASVLPKYYLNLKHERGSTGKIGMSVLSGVVDSSYRGEIFVNITPLAYDIVISKVYDKFIIDENGKKKPTLDSDSTGKGVAMYYPYELAIAQATLDIVPDVNVKEISYEQLLAIPSKRGTGALGSSGK